MRRRRLEILGDLDKLHEPSNMDLVDCDDLMVERAIVSRFVFLTRHTLTEMATAFNPACRLELLL